MTGKEDKSSVSYAITIMEVDTNFKDLVIYLVTNSYSTLGLKTSYNWCMTHAYIHKYMPYIHKQMP